MLPVHNRKLCLKSSGFGFERHSDTATNFFFPSEGFFFGGGRVGGKYSNNVSSMSDCCEEQTH